MVPISVERAWSEQSSWSQVANHLKRDIERKRLLGLGFAILGAMLSATAVVVGLSSASGRMLVFASAASVALGGASRSRIGRQAVRDWTRARSVSEAMKSEVYLYLAGVGDSEFDARIAAIEGDASDLLRYKAEAAPTLRELPPVHDVESYLRIRVGGQIEDYYRPRAQELHHKIALAQRFEVALAVAGALFAGAAAAWEQDAIAVWVPVLTTVGAAVTAHAAAARYEYLLVEYLRTEQELTNVRDRRGSAATLSDEQLVRRAEDVISIQNEGWMAKLMSANNDDSGR